MGWFFDLIGIVFGAAILFFFFVAPVGCYFFTRYERKKEERDDSTCRQDSEPSDDFMEEREDVIRIIAERLAYFGIRGAEGEGMFDYKKLKQSSDIASLFRYAHFAGCHITFESDTCEWKDDPEYLNPDVFKTDIGEAADMRDQRYMQKYKRYYDPPCSQRDRRMIENGTVSYEVRRNGCRYRVVNRT